MLFFLPDVQSAIFDVDKLTGSGRSKIGANLVHVKNN